MKLLETYETGSLKLQNRIVMAPMTRSRAINNIPNELMAQYYEQRADVGLIVTEGIAPSGNGLGYPRIPGLFMKEQVEGFKAVTKAVHDRGAKIFAQLMHTGRVSHPENMPAGSRIVAPSPVSLEGEMYTDSKGPQPYPVPEEMNEDDIEQALQEYVTASRNAIEAGFDGVELHGANGYLIDQFINTASNQRKGKYAGSHENRSRFAIEAATRVSGAIGKERTGIRLSPYGVFSGMEIFEGLEDTYEYLAKELNRVGVLYIHTVDHSSMGSPEVTDSVKEKIRNAFKGTLIASGGFDKEKAEKALQEGRADLVAFGRPVLANPNFAAKIKNGSPLNQPDFDTFYTPGEKGYTDYK